MPNKVYSSTLSALLVTAAILVIDIDEVLVARITSGAVIEDNSRNNLCFKSKFSLTAYDNNCA